MPPAGQIFRPSNLDGTLYRIEGNKVIGFMIEDVLTPEQKAANPSLAQRNALAIQTLQAQGVDYNALPQYQFDAQAFARQIGAPSVASLTEGTQDWNLFSQGKFTGPGSATQFAASGQVTPEGPKVYPNVEGATYQQSQKVQQGIATLSQGIQKTGGAGLPGVSPAGGSQPNVANVGNFAPPPQSSANDYLASLQAGLGQRSVDASLKAFTDYVTNPTNSALSIFKSEFERRGLAQEETLLRDLNKTILEEQESIRKIPENLKATLEDVGVTQAQLDRLATKEREPHLETLARLMEQRGVQAQYIQNVRSDIETYTNFAVKDEAVKLAALQFDVEQKQKTADRLSDDVYRMTVLAQDERKEILKIADDYWKAGGTQEGVNDIVGSKSPVEAYSKVGTYTGSFSSVTADIQKYEYAQRQGYKGTLVDFMAAVNPGDQYTNYYAKQAEMQKVSQSKLAPWLDKRKGTDGYVSPQDFQLARNAWVADGYAATDFDKIFSGYVNPDRAQDYGVNFQTKPQSIPVIYQPTQ